VNLRHLRTFLAIVEAGGFARAAGKVHLSQPALSRQMQLLEAGLGVRLFERVGRQARLTHEAQDLLRHARRVLAEADSFRERARSLKSGQTGVLKLGAAPPVMETLVAGFLVHYLRRHPGIEVELIEDGGMRLPEHLERGDLHLACMPAGDARFEGRLLAPVQLFAVLHEAHRLARGPLVELTDLADEPLLVLREGFGSRAWFDAACAAAHFVPRLALQSVAAQTIIALAAIGYGVAVVPSNTKFTGGPIRVRPLVHRKQSIGRWGMIAWHPGRFLPRYVQHCVDELVAYAQRAYPGREFARRAPALPKPKQP